VTHQLYATLLQVDAVQSQTKAKMPDLTAAMRRAKTAKEVADLVNSAWLTYGAGSVQDGEEPSFELENELDMFHDAMLYLWFKSSDKGSTRKYRMRGKPYEIEAVDNDGVIRVTVRKTAKK